MPVSLQKLAPRAGLIWTAILIAGCTSSTSPAERVEAFLQAIENGRLETARSLASDSFTSEDFEANFRANHAAFNEGGLKVEVVDETISSDYVAIVEIRSSFRGETNQGEVELTRANDESPWLVHQFSN
jgi:hypothetical protein